MAFIFPFSPYFFRSCFLYIFLSTSSVSPSFSLSLPTALYYFPCLSFSFQLFLYFLFPYHFYPLKYAPIIYLFQMYTILNYFAAAYWHFFYTIFLSFCFTIYFLHFFPLSIRLFLSCFSSSTCNFSPILPSVIFSCHPSHIDVTASLFSQSLSIPVTPPSVREAFIFSLNLLSLHYFLIFLSHPSLS